MILLRISNFIKSFLFHLRLGLPKCSQQKIIERYRICDTCEFFNRSKKECGVCGCNVNTKRQFFNKLAWADQECPEGKWKKEI